MTTPRYNPAFLTPAARALRFAGRDHDLAELLRAVRENTARNHNQHVLVLGARGMGKTTLLLRTADVVREQEAAWFPLVAPEELYHAGSLGEVWLELVLQLAKATGDSRHQEAYLALRGERDDTRLATSALGHLLDFADQQQRRLLLVLENLHMLFDEQLAERDAWAFREVLLHERRIMVLASAVTNFPGLRRPDAAMYELFLLHPLEPLDHRGCQALWQAATGSGLPPRHMRALELLTGGNPRLLTLLAEATPRLSLPDLSQVLASLLDAHTEYFKLTTEALPPLERKVFVTLAQVWEEAPASRVAEEARLELNVASAQLGRLESRGFVLSRRQGRGKVYRLAEPLFGLYHLLRRETGGRARATVEFMSFDYGSVAPGTPQVGTLAQFQVEALHPGSSPGALLRPALALASGGAGQQVLDTLLDSPLAPSLEPLLVALRKYLHQEVKVPELVEAIANDLLQDLTPGTSC